MKEKSEDFSKEIILINVTDSDYTIRIITTTKENKEKYKEKTFCYKTKKSFQIGNENIKIENQEFLCDVWELEYDDDSNTIEKLWIYKDSTLHGLFFVNKII